MGKVFSEAKAEVELSADIFDYYARNARALLASERLPVGNPEGEAVLMHDPLGVLLCIEPWNFPYYQIARIIAPQLSAGNTMLLKHASNVPQCVGAFEKLMRDAGLPKGGFKNLYATRSQVEFILNDPRARGVALTGSEDAGAIIAAWAGKALKKSTMELGGADAFVVLADADLEKTTRWAVFGRHWNGGQVCVSSKCVGQITIVASMNVPSLLGEHANELYAKNLLNLLELLTHDQKLKPDWQEEVVAKTTLTYAGQIINKGDRLRWCSSCRGQLCGYRAHAPDVQVRSRQVELRAPP